MSGTLAPPIIVLVKVSFRERESQGFEDHEGFPDCDEASLPPRRGRSVRIYFREGNGGGHGQENPSSRFSYRRLACSLIRCLCSLEAKRIVGTAPLGNRR